MWFNFLIKKTVRNDFNMYNQNIANQFLHVMLSGWFPFTNVWSIDIVYLNFLRSFLLNVHPCPFNKHDKVIHTELWSMLFIIEGVTVGVNFHTCGQYIKRFVVMYNKLTAIVTTVLS